MRMSHVIGAIMSSVEFCIVLFSYFTVIMTCLSLVSIMGKVPCMLMMLCYSGTVFDYV